MMSCFLPHIILNITIFIKYLRIACIFYKYHYNTIRKKYSFTFIALVVLLLPFLSFLLLLFLSFLFAVFLPLSLCR